MRFLVGWEGESKILLDAPAPLTPELTPGLRFYIVAYGGRIIDDAEVLQRFGAYVNGHETFTVSNFILGGDPGSERGNGVLSLINGRRRRKERR